MQLTETLEDLLKLFYAKITAYSDSEFIVESDKALPDTVQGVASNIEITMSTTPMKLLGETTVQELVGQVNYEYTFKTDAKEALRALLFLATEKERYDEFCEAFDKEVEQELDSKHQ